MKGSTDLRFTYDGDHMAAQYDGSGNLQYRYIFGPGTDEPLLQYNSSGARTWYTADERGSIIGNSNDSGAFVVANSYDEYGIPGSSNSGRFQYTGQMWVPELGMYFYKARAYSPTLGRFLQTDPIGYGDGMNDYAYTHNDPVNGTDRMGLCGEVSDSGSVVTYDVCDEPSGQQPIVVTGQAPDPDAAAEAASDSAGLSMLADSITTGYGSCSSADCRGAIVVTGYRKHPQKSTTAPPPPPVPPIPSTPIAASSSAPEMHAAQSHWACGIRNGKAGCWMASDKELCEGAKARMDLVGGLGFGQALLSSKDLLKKGASDVLLEILLTEYALDWADEQEFCHG